MKRPSLPARIEEIEPGQWCVTFADLPEALTGGRTFQAARAQADDALATALDGYVLLGRPFPPSRAPAGTEILITPSW